MNDDEIHGWFDGEQENGKQFERHQRDGRLGETTNAHDRRVDHVRSLRPVDQHTAAA